MTLLAKELVWNNNGEFYETVHVIVRLDENGTFHVVKTMVDGHEVGQKSNSTAPGNNDTTLRL